LLGAVAVGLTGIAFIPQYHIKMEDPETLFIIMSQILFHPLVGGFLLAAILAAIISTISSQLFVTSSSLFEDFYILFCGEDSAIKYDKDNMIVRIISIIVIDHKSIIIAYYIQTIYHK